MVKQTTDNTSSVSLLEMQLQKLENSLRADEYRSNITSKIGHENQLWKSKELKAYSRNATLQLRFQHGLKLLGISPERFISNLIYISELKMDASKFDGVKIPFTFYNFFMDEFGELTLSDSLENTNVIVFENLDYDQLENISTTFEKFNACPDCFGRGGYNTYQGDQQGSEACNCENKPLKTKF
jgi:hypothetical protein